MPLRLFLAALVVAATAHAAGRLTSRPPAQPTEDKTLKAGDTLTTASGEQRRVRLPDRSLVFVRQGTTLNVTKAGALAVESGEVFVEASSDRMTPPLKVKTPGRELETRGGRFGVRAGEGGTALVVASGSVKVEGIADPVKGGELLAEKAERPSRAARVSHLVAWTKGLRNDTPVPASGHAGGSLIAVDPDGQEAKLELRKYHVDVHVEDGFARTTIDQTFFNHSLDRMEGTFRFPLPPDASLNRLAMYVDGNLMEGGMAERDHARATYERIRYEQRDPALLEWVDGSTFKMRVFPIEARQEKRIILSYTQRLPVLYGQVSYRFPAGDALASLWTLNVRVKGGKGMAWACDSHAPKARVAGDDLILTAEQKAGRIGRDLVLSFTEKASPEYRLSSVRHEGAAYLLVRYRPALEAAKTAGRRDWVVLVETSGDRDPLLARTQIELVRAFLTNCGRDDSFVILTGATRTKALRPKAVRNEPVAVEEVVADLEKAHLIGAFDMGAALDAARPYLATEGAHLVHLGSGIAAMGERRPQELLKRLPRGARYVGVGVGRRWDRAMMQTLAEKTGGFFTQANPDEPASWRGMELASTLATPRLLNVSVTDPAGKVTFLPFVRMAAQGEEVAAVARCEGGLPEKVRITGTLDGREVSSEIDVKAEEGAGHLPRSWAKLEIDRLLAEDAAKHKETIVALSKAMYVMTPFTSLLVLENDDMYKQFKVDRGRKDHWAIYPAPQKIKVVIERLEGDEGDVTKGIKPSRKTVAETLAMRRWEAARGPRGTVAIDTLPTLGAVVIRGDARRSGVADAPPDQNEVEALMLHAPEPSTRTITLPGGAPLMAEELARLMGKLRKKQFRTTDADHNRTITELDGRLSYFNDRIEDLSAPGKAEPAAAVLDKKRVTDDFRTPILPPMISAGRGEWHNGALLRDGVASTLAFEPQHMVTSSGRYVRPEGGTPLYRRPAADTNDRVFFDLLMYAPGLNTSGADVRAVLDAEARPDPNARAGKIDPKARALFDAARKPAWRTYAVEGVKVSFDGAGRFAWERTPAGGLKEQAVCDGTLLVHGYPEIGLAARRTVSRHHRLALASGIPCIVPAPEDVARGADLVLIDDSTAALVPHLPKDAKKHHELRFVFDGAAIKERVLVEMPAKKTLRREVYEEGGAWKVFDGDGKEVASVKAEVKACEKPTLSIKTGEMVTLDLPHRTPDFTRKALGVEKKANAELTFAQATTLLASLVAHGDAGNAQQVFAQALAAKDQRQIGYYVLLASAGVNLDSDNTDVLDAHPHEPLAHYLSLHSSPTLRKHASRWAASSNVWGDGALRRLGLGHAFTQRWASGKALGVTPAQRAAERKRALAYAGQYKGTALAWNLLGLMQDRTAEEKDESERKKAYLELANAYAAFSEGGAARYERARCLHRGGDVAQARKLFTALHDEAWKGGGLLSIDADFRAALAGAGWEGLMRGAASELVAKKERAAVLFLAVRAHSLDDLVMARRLMAMALKDVPVTGDENLALYGAAISWLSKTEGAEEAERLVNLLLAEEKNRKIAAIWRTAARLADARENPARALECREKAIALEFEAKGGVVDLEHVRSDYKGLLGNYSRLVDALATLKIAPPAGFKDRVVLAADRWRALDPEQAEACTTASGILRTLGERELAFDYLVTPAGIRPGEADVWAGMAATLAGQGERELADRAYASAFERESTNAQYLWDRAENLRRAGRAAAASKLYAQVAEGDWQPRFAALKQQARWLAEGKE